MTEVAREYRRRGYTVVRDPEVADLPPPLQRFEVDLVALAGEAKEANLVIEVRTAESLRDSRLVELAGVLSDMEGWQLLLVVTNPRKTAAWLVDTPASPGSWSQLEQQRKTALELLSKGYTQPALLMAWVVLEGSLRRVGSDIKGAREYPLGPMELISMLATEGIVDTDEYAQLRDLALLRNRVAHGFDVDELPPDAASRLLELSSTVRQRAELTDETHAQAT